MHALCIPYIYRKCSVEDHSLAKLVDLGFRIEDARSALSMSHGHVEDAANLLAIQPEL